MELLFSILFRIPPKYHKYKKILCFLYKYNSTKAFTAFFLYGLGENPAHDYVTAFSLRFKIIAARHGKFPMFPCSYRNTRLGQ